jgi:transcription elongation factor Elf1
VTGSDGLEQFTEVICPHCGEVIGVRIDVSAGSHSYIEDCEVCCQPIEFLVRVDDAGMLESVEAGR